MPSGHVSPASHSRAQCVSGNTKHVFASQVSPAGQSAVVAQSAKLDSGVSTQAGDALPVDASGHTPPVHTGEQTASSVPVSTTLSVPGGQSSTCGLGYSGSLGASPPVTSGVPVDESSPPESS